MSFPARLKALLEDRKISMRELGRRIGTSHVTVGKWLSGIQMPSDENLEALAEYFHVTPAFLRFGDTSLLRPQTLEPNEDVVSIPVLDVRGSCGYGGELAQTIQLVQMPRVTKQWLLSKSTSFLNFQTLGVHLFHQCGVYIDHGHFVVAAQVRAVQPAHGAGTKNCDFHR